MTEQFGDGRYPGDLRAELIHDPMDHKYPFEVRVFEWRESYASKPGVREWCIPFPDRFQSKHFRRLNKAVDYLYSVKAKADLHLLLEDLRDAAEARTVRLL